MEDKLNFKVVSDEELVQVNGGGQILMNGANGYLTRDKNGKYRYVVTKGPFDAVVGVMANGWGSAGSGFGPQYKPGR
ncbi:garvicin Q family class II bacteriocin [Lactococcus lactis]|uniref:garvicin Q family class II bacteriocin n=1 Tax=Lactococcus lactis TaxID=1358 RepID=UPI0037C624A6